MFSILYSEVYLLLFFYILKETVQVEKDVLQETSKKILPIFFSLFLPHSEIWFHCCANTFKGAFPGDVVLIYRFVNISLLARGRF